MKKLISAVSFILALVMFTGCQSNIKTTSSNAPSDEGTTVAQTKKPDEAKLSHSMNKEFLPQAEEVSNLLLTYAFPKDKVTEPGAQIDEAFFPRIANYMVYNYMRAALSSTIKGQSRLYAEYLSLSPEDQKAVISREDMSLIVYKLFGLNSIPATLISSKEFVDEKNQFEFSFKEPEKIGVNFTDLSAFFDEDGNIIVDFKIKDDDRNHGFYRIVYNVMIEDGEEFLRFNRLFQL